MQHPTRAENAGGRSVAVRFVDQRTLSAMLSIPERTLERWRLENRGPRFRKLGRSVRYSLVDIDLWVAESPAGGGQP